MVMQREPEVEPDPDPVPDPEPEPPKAKSGLAGEPSQKPKTEPPGERTAQREREPEATTEPRPQQPRASSGVRVVPQTTATAESGSKVDGDAAEERMREVTHRLQTKVSDYVRRAGRMVSKWIENYKGKSVEETQAAASEQLEKMYGDQSLFDALTARATQYLVNSAGKTKSFEDQWALATALRYHIAKATGSSAADAFGIIRDTDESFTTPLGPTATAGNMEMLESDNIFSDHIQEIREAFVALQDSYTSGSYASAQELVQLWADTSGNNRIYVANRFFGDSEVDINNVPLMMVTQDAKYAAYVGDVINTLIPNESNGILSAVHLYDGIRLSTVEYSESDGQRLPGQDFTAAKSFPFGYHGGLVDYQTNPLSFAPLVDKLEGFHQVLREHEPVRQMPAGQARDQALEEIVNAAVSLTHLTTQAAMTQRGGTAVAENLGASWLAHHTDLTVSEALGLLKSPYIRFLADPENVIANDVRKILDKLGVGQPPLTSGTMKLSGDEAEGLTMKSVATVF